MNFTNFIPNSIREWIMVILIALLLCTIFAFYRAIMKCKDIISGYITDLRNYQKFVEFKQLNDEYESFCLGVHLSTDEVINNV